MRLALEVGEETAARVRVEPLLLLQHLDVRLHARQRRAQLVRGVGDEPALCLERLLERREHRVERAAEPRQLVAAADGHALARLARLCDALCCAGEAPHRDERRARHERAARGARSEAAGEDEQQNQLEPVQGAVDVVGRTHELDGGAVCVARGVDDLRDVDRVDARLLATDASVGEERPTLPRRDCKLVGDRDLRGLVRSEPRAAVVGDELQVRRRRARPVLRRGERPVLEGVVQEPAVTQHLLVLLHQLLVNARMQLIAHHDVDDGRRHRDRHRDGERSGKREPQTEGHGSRST